MIIWASDLMPSRRMSESSSLRSLPTNDIRSMLLLAIASSSSDFRPQMRTAMAFSVQRDFPPRISSMSRDANPPSHRTSNPMACTAEARMRLAPYCFTSSHAASEEAGFQVHAWHLLWRLSRQSLLRPLRLFLRRFSFFRVCN
jgi:hypothetical protein